MLIYGLIGGKLSHSFSPVLHDIIFKNSDIKGKYQLFEVEKTYLKKQINDLRNSKVKGFNVTIPYKLEALKYVDEISAEAKVIGAVNTLDFKGGKVIGYNTDYYGFGASLRRENIGIKDKTALILGTGGASKAVFHYLKNNGIKNVIFASRNPERAKSEYPDSDIIEYDELENIGHINIIINATPVGMYPDVDESPVGEDVICKFDIAVDLIYNPIETKFLQIAKNMDMKTANGLYMLVAQGIKSQEIWNEKKFGKVFYNKIYNGVIEYVK